MPTPSNRTPLRVARGTYSNLNSSVSDIQEGEICYATDQDKLYVKESGSLVSTQADLTNYAQDSDIGSTIQAFDPDTAKTDVAQNFTAPQRLAVNTLTSAASITIDFSTGNNFILTTGHAAIAFANPTTEVAGQSGSIFIVQGSTTCAAPTWGDQYLFAGGAAPALTGTTGKIARIDYIVQEAGKIHCVTTDNLTAT